MWQNICALPGVLPYYCYCFHKHLYTHYRHSKYRVQQLEIAGKLICVLFMVFDSSIGAVVHPDGLRFSICPFRWWPYSNLILSSPMWDTGRISGIHSMINGVGSCWSAVVLPEIYSFSFVIVQCQGFICIKSLPLTLASAVHCIKAHI